MAIYRNVSMAFWTDGKIVDDFSPEDRYFYLYLLTNPHTRLCGCYEISVKQIADEMGYSVQKIRSLIERLEKKHDVIRYSTQTKEVLILNWNKYNWTRSEKMLIPIYRELETIKNADFKAYLTEILNGNDTVSIGYQYGMDIRARTVTVTDTDTVSDTVTVTDPVDSEEDIKTKEAIKEIVDYFNEVTGKHYTYTGKDTVKFIKARLKEKFTVEDFKTVIFKKASQWHGTDMEQYIRPQTLFSNKFESYLNESTPFTRKDELDEWAAQDVTAFYASEFDEIDPVIVEGETDDG